MFAMKFASTLFITTMLAAATVLAQPTGTQPGPMPGTSPAPTESTPAPDTSAPATTTHRGHGHHSAAATTPGQTMEALVERRITQLHKQLQITPAESSQWDQFTQVMRDNAKEIDQAFKDRADKLDSMSAVDNMLSYAQIEQLRAEQSQKLVLAFQTLYASLSDEQKQRADALFRNQSVRQETHRQAAAAKHAPK
jgi:periplasmic protein CpxP/Spy